jgi:UDP-glucose:(heptosyl)LPS alpha-1,3-glucosyltransferase
MASSALTSHKQKVAVLSRNFSKSAGGAENYAVNLAEKLSDEFEVHVFCERSDVSHPSITIHRMGRNLNRPRWIALWLFAWWSWRQTRQGFAIVHSHENTWHGNVQTAHVRPMRYSLFAQAATPLRKCRVYLKIITSPRLLGHLGLERLRFVGDNQRVIVAVAPSLADIIASTYHPDKQRLRVVPPGIHWPAAADHLGPQGKSKRDARKAMGLPQEAWILLLLGHNFEKKGIAAVLRSLTLLPADALVLVVGGSTEQVNTWRARCVERGLQGRVVFVGTLPDASLAFVAVDCLVHATLDDMFPLVVLEAMAAKVPVLLSVAPFCLASPLVQTAQAAWMLQDPHSELEIAHGVASLRADLALRQAQIDRATEFVQNHGWSQIAMQQAQIYRELLSANSAPPGRKLSE